MDQKAYLAITAMLNAFPQGAPNPDLTLRTYEAVLAGNSSEAVIRTAQRFTSGDVPEQSRTFAPSIAEFTQEARRQEEYLSIKARPRLQAPEPFYAGGMPPFMVTRQRLLAENAHREVLHENIGFDQFKKLSAAREIPVGGKWVAALVIIYGPEPKQSRQAAE